MKRVYGFDLHDDTLVHYYSGIINAPCRATAKEVVFIEFVYAEDGLWASLHVRQYWDKHPHTHPGCTLFRLLYKKLQL